MHDPRKLHLAALKRILRYLQGTLSLGLTMRRSSPTELVVYTDADWAGCPDTRRSTSGYAVFLGDNLVSWSSKHQHTVAQSSAEAEYRAVANGVAEATWLCQLLHELCHPPRRTTLVYCDNISAVYLSSNPVQHQRTKHVSPLCSGEGRPRSCSGPSCPYDIPVHRRLYEGPSYFLVSGVSVHSKCSMCSRSDCGGVLAYCNYSMCNYSR
jgi:hypothetical protein